MVSLTSKPFQSHCIYWTTLIFKQKNKYIKKYPFFVVAHYRFFFHKRREPGWGWCAREHSLASLGWPADYGRCAHRWPGGMCCMWSKFQTSGTSCCWHFSWKVICHCSGVLGPNNWFLMWTSCVPSPHDFAVISQTETQNLCLRPCRVDFAKQLWAWRDIPDWAPTRQFNKTGRYENKYAIYAYTHGPVTGSGPSVVWP